MIWWPDHVLESLGDEMCLFGSPLRKELWVPDLGDKSKVSAVHSLSCILQTAGFMIGGMRMPQSKRNIFWLLSCQCDSFGWLEHVSGTDSLSSLINVFYYLVGQH